MEPLCLIPLFTASLTINQRPKPTNKKDAKKGSRDILLISAKIV